MIDKIKIPEEIKQAELTKIVDGYMDFVYFCINNSLDISNSKSQKIYNRDKKIKNLLDGKN